MIQAHKLTPVENVVRGYALQSLLVSALRQTKNHSHLVARASACGTAHRHWRCEHNHDWAVPEESCSLRVCPHCARRKANKMAFKVESFVEGRGGLRYAVLSERNSERLADGIKSLWRAWRRLQRSRRWRGHVRGCIVVMEVTYNREEMTWHPHLNVLMEGNYFPFDELRQAWEGATDDQGHTTFIRAADEGTTRELIKYVTKVSDLCRNPAALDEFLTAVHGARLIRTYGSFYGMNVDDDDKPEMGQCPDCGPHKHVAVIDLGFVHPMFVRLDRGGVFRVGRTGQSLRDAMAEAFRVRGPDIHGPRWRPKWADPVAGREPVKLRTVRDDNRGDFLLSTETGQSLRSQRQSLFGGASGEGLAGGYCEA